MDRDTSRTTEWVRLHGESDERYIRAKYGMSWLRGNRQPYFSITGDIVERAAPHNRGEMEFRGDGLPEGIWRYAGGGCVHEDIARTFPHLAPLIRWHLVAQDGVPMHCLENADYWLRKHLGIFRLFAGSEPEGRRPGEPDPLEAYKGTIVFGAVRNDDVDLRRVLERKPATWPDVGSFVHSAEERIALAILAESSEWLKARLPRLRTAFLVEMKYFGVKLIPESVFRPREEVK